MVGCSNGKAYSIDALEQLEDAGYENLCFVRGGYNLWTRYWDNNLRRRRCACARAAGSRLSAGSGSRPVRGVPSCCAVGVVHRLPCQPSSPLFPPHFLPPPPSSPPPPASTPPAPAARAARSRDGEYAEKYDGEGADSCGIHASGAGFDKVDKADKWNLPVY